ncbi:MAG: hypothetical protein OXI96_08870 [Acidimicrobiaceae bacterium]|nr:hypothetical protein [Acidimicrobiaceae bacterium]
MQGELAELSSHWDGLSSTQQGAVIAVAVALFVVLLVVRRFAMTWTLPRTTRGHKINLYVGQKGLCKGCKESFDPQTLQVDHIEPQSLGVLIS